MLVDQSRPEAILAYIHAAQPVHAGLQQVLTQAAGYALLVMTRGRRFGLLDGPVVTAREALSAIRADLASLRVPQAARHHHHHVAAAADALNQALDRLTTCLRLRADDRARADPTGVLRLATDHLRAATRLLPGFGMVDLSQACCAVHAGQPSGLLCQTVEG